MTSQVQSTTFASAKLTRSSTQGAVSGQQGSVVNYKTCEPYPPTPHPALALPPPSALFPLPPTPFQPTFSAILYWFQVYSNHTRYKVIPP